MAYIAGHDYCFVHLRSLDHRANDWIMRPLKDDTGEKGPSVLRTAANAALPFLGDILSSIQRGYNEFVPSNVRAGVKFALGDTRTLDEDFFTSEQHDVIRKAIETAKADGRNYVMYADYPPGSTLNLTKTHWGGLNEAGALTDPDLITLTTLGRFTFDETDDGYQIHDAFDFNTRPETILGDDGMMAGILDMTVEEYRKKYSGLSDVPQLYSDFNRKLEEKKEAGDLEMGDGDYIFLRRGLFPLLQDRVGRESIPVEASISKHMNGGRFRILKD